MTNSIRYASGRTAPISSSVSWKLREYAVSGIPGAKIDKVFDSLLDSSIRIIPVRHRSQRRVYGRRRRTYTGKAGVALVTSGPGCFQPDHRHGHREQRRRPGGGLGGAVKRADKAKQVHQSMDTVAMFSPVTKYAVEVTAPDALAEVVSNAFRAAEQAGQAARSLACRRMWSMARSAASAAGQQGPRRWAPRRMMPSTRWRSLSPRRRTDLPARPDGQPAGKQQGAAPFAGDQPYSSHQHLSGRRAVNQDNFSRFAGRVGLFNNQAGDRLLQLADLVICIGYSPVEYEPAMWNSGNATLVRIDVLRL